MIKAIKTRFSKLRWAIPHILRRGLVFGFCPICEKSTVFLKEGKWLRDDFRCMRCTSLPRGRALISVLESFVPRWREMSIHESSPGGASSSKLARDCKHYCATHYYPDVPLGQMKDGFRCENLEQQTFLDESFDLVVTQDVFEHVLEPAKAIREICRTLKPGGAHVFTVPWYYWKDTLVRAVRDGTGIRHLEKPDYHGNPIDSKGSLVVTEWGADFCDFVQRESGMTTTAVRIFDRRRGIEAEFIEVFISRKLAAGIKV